MPLKSTDAYNLMSSAYNLHVVFPTMISHTSLIKMMNKIGPKTLSCGTPLITLTVDE